jgi:hypothetical protein
MGVPSSAAVPLPLRLRNRLAALIVDSLSDSRARAALGALAAAGGDPRSLEDGMRLLAAFPGDLREPRPGAPAPGQAWARQAEALGERAARAWTLLRERPLLPPDPPLAAALAAAAALWDARLYFEVHEWLERFWSRATEPERTALQGLIQAAVGFQHLENGNIAGALALLREGADKLAGRAIEGTDLGSFAGSVRRAADRIAALGPAAGTTFPWAEAPRLPRWNP